MMISEEIFSLTYDLIRRFEIAGRLSEHFNRFSCHKIDERNVISSVTLKSYHHRKNYCYEETTPCFHSHDRRFN